MLASSAPRSLLTHAGRGNSDMDACFSQISIFMRGTGAIQSVPQSTDFITDVYMKRVAADPKLRDFANNAK